MGAVPFSTDHRLIALSPCRHIVHELQQRPADVRQGVFHAGRDLGIYRAGDDAVVEVYNIAGQRVYSGTATSIALDRGLYIVRVAGSTFKVAL